MMAGSYRVLLLSLFGSSNSIVTDSLQGALAARVILTAINIRLTPGEVAYILGMHLSQIRSSFAAYISFQTTVEPNLF